MRINPISINNNIFRVPPSRKQDKQPVYSNYNYSSYPIMFLGEMQKHRTVPEIDFHAYQHMSESMKKFYRKRCQNFSKEVCTQELADPKLKYLPLMNDSTMKDFIDVCNIYNNIKGTPIICLGRSPKWFLNTALWMKNGIDKYTFVAFSDYWYAFNRYHWGKYDSKVPKPEEKKAYRKYLQTMKATPKDIVNQCKETGKKVVITDYISSGKGMTSFLDILSEFAEDDGILEEFANSIRILAIGSMDYLEEKFYYDDELISIPEVQMPERLRPYKKIIKQEYHDIPRRVFDDMLVNQNTNECRSSYYPCWVWNIYKPYNFKTGMISVDKAKTLTENSKKSLVNFSPAMRDYKNLLNFRILDYLATHDLLKDKLDTKQTD